MRLIVGFAEPQVPRPKSPQGSPSHITMPQPGLSGGPYGVFVQKHRLPKVIHHVLQQVDQGEWSLYSVPHRSPHGSVIPRYAQDIITNEVAADIMFTVVPSHVVYAIDAGTELGKVEDRVPLSAIPTSETIDLDAICFGKETYGVQTIRITVQAPNLAIQATGQIVP